MIIEWGVLDGGGGRGCSSERGVGIRRGCVCVKTAVKMSPYSLGHVPVIPCSKMDNTAPFMSREELFAFQAGSSRCLLLVPP